MVERVTISMDKKLVDELRRLAKSEGTSLSKLISRSLEEFLIERKKKEAGRKLFKIKFSTEEAQEALTELSRMRNEEWR